MSSTPHSLESQVGGHPGVLSSEDGSLIIKPCKNPTEIEFYQEVTSNPALKQLKPHIPKFYGTLQLHGQVEDAQQTLTPESKIEPVAGEDKDESLVPRAAERQG